MYDNTTHRGTADRRSACLGLLAGAVTLAALVAGCGGSSKAAGQSSVETQGALSGLPVAQQKSTDLPSRSAQMVCGQGIRLIIEKTLGLSDLPPTNASWSNHTFTCTYNIPGNPLVMSVKELPDAVSAQHYLTVLRERIIGASDQLIGVASLGLTGFESISGQVIFAKDNMTLQVDTSGMPEQIGPNQVSRGDYAYQLATNILACWSGG